MKAPIEYPKPFLDLSCKIKICGLTRAEDIITANDILPDYIGFVFAPSRRQVTVSKAIELKGALDPSILSVGVFVNEDLDKVIQLCESDIIDMVQLHGDEDEEYIAGLKSAIPHPIIKAIRVGHEYDIHMSNNFSCDYLLLDSYKKGSYGGNGTSFDWSLISNINKPFFLAGGIHAENILDGVMQCKPFCIDVSSGVETNGLKDPQKMEDIVNILRNI